MMEYFEIEEGNLKAVKDTGTFGGPNMWNLYVKDTTDNWVRVQWMGVYNTQKFFKTKLPKYEIKTEVEVKRV